MQNHSLIFAGRTIFEKNTPPKSLVVKHPVPVRFDLMKRKDYGIMIKYKNGIMIPNNQEVYYGYL